jgi:hypothetical protein
MDYLNARVERAFQTRTSAIGPEVEQHWEYWVRELETERKVTLIDPTKRDAPFASEGDVIMDVPVQWEEKDLAVLLNDNFIVDKNKS